LGEVFGGSFFIGDVVVNVVAPGLNGRHVQIN
jgi:hypothetical protein